MGKIRDFFRSTRQNVLKSDLKSPGFVPFGANLAFHIEGINYAAVTVVLTYDLRHDLFFCRVIHIWHDLDPPYPSRFSHTGSEMSYDLDS